MKKLLSLRNNKKALEKSGFSGDQVLSELEKHHKAVQERLSSINISISIMDIEKREWNSFLARSAKEAKTAKDANRRATFARLESISAKTASSYDEQRKKLAVVRDELEETSSRLDESISVLKIERNLHSIISILPQGADIEPIAGIEDNMRDVKRVLYTADAILELTR